MSRRSSTSAKGGKKAKGVAADPDVYVAMLYVSVVALMVGVIFLYFECERYGWLTGK